MNIILFGPPGAGKGTQADIIANDFNLYNLNEQKHKTPRKEKFKGPIGVIQSMANPVELLISSALSNDVS